MSRSWLVTHMATKENDMRQYLRFTDYDGRDDGSYLVVGWQGGVEKLFVHDDLPNELDDDEECYWNVISEKFGRITFQSIDLEEDE